MNDAPFAWRSVGPAFVRGWQAFFGAAVDVRLLGWLRVLYATVLLVNIGVWWLHFDRWFGDAGVLPFAAAERLLDDTSLTLLRWLPRTDGTMCVCYCIFVVQATLLLVGVFPRCNAVGCFLWLTSFQQRNPIIWDGEDHVMRLLGFYLMFLPLHRVPWRFWQRPATESAAVVPAWALRFMQLQMCLIYLDTAAAKMTGNTWLDGTAVYFVPRLDEFYRSGVVPDVLFEIPWLVRLMTWGVLVIEFAVPVLIWFRETRRASLALVLLFHIACFATMHLFLFHPIMLVGWLTFATTADLDAIARCCGRKVRNLS